MAGLFLPESACSEVLGENSKAFDKSSIYDARIGTIIFTEEHLAEVQFLESIFEDTDGLK